MRRKAEIFFLSFDIRILSVFLVSQFSVLLTE